MFRLNQGMWLALAITLFSVTGAQADTKVQAPCSDNAQSGLKSCKELILNGTPADTAAGVPAFPPIAPPSGNTGQIFQRVQATILGNPAASASSNPPNQVKGWYQHVDPDPINPPGPNFAPTICNLVPGPFNGNAAEGLGTWSGPNSLKNSLGDSCGNPIQLQCQGHVNISLTPPSYSNPTVSTQILKAWNRNPDLAQGTLEDGYGFGGLAAATTCYYQQVVNEIQTNHVITVRDEGSDHHASPCASLAAQGVQLTATLGADVQSLQSQLTSAQNIADITNCNKSGSDGGVLRQSAQNLCAHRLAMESIFIQVAACEVYARAQYSYMKQVGSSQGQLNIQQMLMNTISNPCSNQCQSQLNPGVFNRPSDQDITNCANTCYRQKLAPAFQQYLQGLWPADGSGLHCDPLSRNDTPSGLPSSFAGIFWIGMLGGVRRKKSSPSTQGKRFAATIVIGSLGIVGVAAEMMIANGCGGSSGAGFDTPCYYNGCGLNTTGNESCIATPPGQTMPCPCYGANVATPGPDQTSCPSTVAPVTGSIGGSLVGGFEAHGSGTGAIKTETGLLGLSKPATGGGSGGGDPAILGATAGDVASGGPGGPTVAAGAGVPNPTTSANTPGGLVGAQGASSNGGGSGSFGNAQTAPAAGDGVLGAAATADPNAGGGMYKSGNGSGNANGAAGDGMGPFGHGGNGLGADGTGNTEQSFNADMNGTKGVASSSDDPADYFTRLGLNDNLFKVVERRYRQKATHWVTDDLVKPDPLLAPAKKTSK